MEMVTVLALGGFEDDPWIDDLYDGGAPNNPSTSMFAWARIILAER